MSVLKKIIRYTPDDFFTSLEVLFKVNGFLPPKKSIPRMFYLLIAIPHVLIATFGGLILETIALYTKIINDLQKSMFGVCCAGLDIIFIFRIIMWFFNKNKTTKIKLLIRRESFNFSCFNIEGFQLNQEKKNLAKWNFVSYTFLRTLWKTSKVNISKNE